MTNRFASPEGPRAHLGSSLYTESKHGGPEHKRASVVETLGRIQEIMAILPEDSKRKIGNQVEKIRKSPEQAIQIIRDEIEAQRSIIDLLDNDISTDEALAELDKIIPKDKIQ